ncbi:MAG TPA: tetratricopeptide repeat protein [Planctomycetota bacterium]
MDVSKLIEKAREAAERRNYDYAIDLYLQALKLAPDTALARRELRAVENRKAKESGTSFWSKTKNAGNYAIVQTLYTTGKYDSAIEKAEETLKSDPSNVAVLMLLGKACRQQGYKQSAIATFEDIRNMNAGGNEKSLVAALRELAFAYEDDGKINEASDTWQLVARKFPGDRDATIKMRDLAAKRMTGTIEAAAKSGERGGIARSTQTEEQKKEAGRLDREKGFDIKTAEDLKAAIDDAKGDIQQRPDDPRLYAKLGDLYKQGSAYAEAKKAYETAREKDANNYTYLFKLHDLEIWKFNNALTALKQKATAGDAAAGEQLKTDYLSFLEYRLTSFLEREKQYSTDSRIRFELGCIYSDLANAKNDRSLHDQAIVRFQSTFRDPKYRLESGLRMGKGFATKGQYELALKRFDETLAGIPKEIKNEIWKNLTYAKADTLYSAKRLEESKKVFLEIYEVDVSFRDIAKRIDDLGQVAGPSSDSLQ